MSMLPHFLDNRLTGGGGEVVCLMRQPPFTPRKNAGTISVPTTTVLLEGLKT
jgi:hypothetical protein